jgi:hypothetical protein
MQHITSRKRFFSFSSSVSLEATAHMRGPLHRRCVSHAVA